MTKIKYLKKETNSKSGTLSEISLVGTYFTWQDFSRGMVILSGRHKSKFIFIYPQNISLQDSLIVRKLVA